MSTRQDRREQQLRDRRRQERKASGPRRGMSGWLTAAIVVGVAVLAIFGARQAGMFEPPAPPVSLPPVTNEVVGVHQTDNGNAHVPTGQAVQYTPIPPTSGNHWEMPHAGWGVKTSTARDEMVVHNLEHGGIAIMYKGLSADELNQLSTTVRSLNGQGYPKIVLEPYPNLTDAKIAVTAWNWILKQNTYDQGQLIRFVQTHYGPKGESPEPNGV